MLLPHAEKLRDVAAEPTMDRMQRDHDRAPQRLKRLVQYIVENLFDPGFTVGAMQQACGMRDNSISTILRGALGESPADYVRIARLEVAARLLSNTDLAVWQIVELVGYSRVDSFGKAFGAVYRTTPTDFGKASRRVAARLPPIPTEMDSILFAEKALGGQLSQEDADSLIARLEDVFEVEHEAVHEISPVKITLDPSLFGETQAKQIWQAIREAPFERSRATVRLHGSRTLFDLLLKKSRQEGRGDALRGVELALLAVESLEGCAAELGEAVHDLRALGWAWVANARRFLPGRAGAEEAFRQAEAAWCAPRASPDPNVEALLWDYKAALRSYERRFAEALELENRAVERYQVLGAITLEAAALIERGRIHLYAGNPQGTIVDNHRAIALLGEHESYLRLSGYQTLAIAYVRIEDFSSAADALRQAKRLCSGYPEAWLKIRWVEGLIHQGQSDIARAETCLVEAHQGLSELDQIEDAAVVALDRAILCAEQGRSAEVVPLAAEVAAVFEASRVERERLAALRVLGAEVAEGAVNLAVLREAREELQSLASCDTGGSGDVPDPPVLASQLNWSKQC